VGRIGILLSAPAEHVRMNDTPLSGLRVFVAEDEYLLALDLCDILASAGAAVIGPARSRQEAEAHLLSQPAMDVALLDLNLGGDSSVELALRLRGDGVPVILTTGYDATDVPAPLQGIPICLKPLSGAIVIKSVLKVVNGSA
jgi:DNA-binding LytR/AlgR family response regulator